MRGKEETAVNLIAAALGDDFDLPAAEAPVFGVVAVRDDLDAVDRIFSWRNYRRPTPNCAGRADPVNRDSVVLVLLAMSNRLSTIFRLENSLIAAGGARSLRSGQTLTCTSSTLGAIAEDARRELNELKHVTSERRHVID